ncbi:MAG: outer membrane beta-barrel domain-containing protein [Deltaproteobacteria bacterium]|nr:outer membrane beta-barrel domain-containing protein [Deltaproteobacteria bacterium]
MVAALLVPATSWAEDEESEESAKESEESEEARVEKAEDSGKSFEDRIKSVQRKVFLKKSRFEIFPQFALDLNDPFYQHLLVGAAVGYHFADSLSFEARGGVAIASLKQSVIRLVRVEEGALFQNPPELKFHADADLLWAPVYGKISLFGESILHFDTYVTAGAGVFGTDLAAAPAINVGFGQRYFISDWLVARVEIRDYAFVEDRNNRSSLQNLLVLGFAVSGFFPTAFEYEFP